MERWEHSRENLSIHHPIKLGFERVVVEPEQVVRWVCCSLLPWEAFPENAFVLLHWTLSKMRFIKIFLCRTSTVRSTECSAWLFPPLNPGGHLQAPSLCSSSGLRSSGGAAGASWGRGIHLYSMGQRGSLQELLPCSHTGRASPKEEFLHWTPLCVVSGAAPGCRSGFCCCLCCSELCSCPSSWNPNSQSSAPLQARGSPAFLTKHLKTGINPGCYQWRASRPF